MNHAVGAAAPQPRIRENCLYRLNIPGSFGWCKHGLVTVHGEYAVDTYWGIGANCSSSAGYPIWQVADAMEFICDLTEMRDCRREEWERYADTDRAHIPIGGGNERWLVRKGAHPDFARVRYQLESGIAACKAEAMNAQLRQQQYEIELTALLASEARNG